MAITLDGCKAVALIKNDKLFIKNTDSDENLSITPLTNEIDTSRILTIHDMDSIRGYIAIAYRRQSFSYVQLVKINDTGSEAQICATTSLYQPLCVCFSHAGDKIYILEDRDHVIHSYDLELNHIARHAFLEPTSGYTYSLQRLTKPGRFIAECDKRSTQAGVCTYTVQEQNGILSIVNDNPKTV